MELLELLKERYSVRKYSDRPVEQEKLDKIIEAAMVAPSAKNFQPVRIYVLKSEEAIARIRGITRCAYNAPVVMMVTVDKNIEWHNELEEGITSGQQDAAIAATHMMLEAASLGVGSVWVCWFPNTAVHEAFELPENEKVVLLMPMGYAADDSKPVANHFNKISKEEMVREL